MASTRYAQYQLANDPVFRGIVEASVMAAANNVINETFETPDHEQRVALAQTFTIADAANRPALLQQFIWQAALNPTIQTETKSGTDKVMDESVDYVVSAQWDSVAGVSAQAEPDTTEARVR